MRRLWIRKEGPCLGKNDPSSGKSMPLPHMKGTPQRRSPGRERQRSWKESEVGQGVTRDQGVWKGPLRAQGPRPKGRACPLPPSLAPSSLLWIPLSPHQPLLRPSPALRRLWLQLFHSMSNLPGPGIGHTSPVLEGRSLSTVPPRTS